MAEMGGLLTNPIDAPFCHSVLKRLAQRAKIVTPALYIVRDPAPNAFAVGLEKDDSAVAVTTGLLRALDEHEIEGVLGHEVGHIQQGHSVAKTRIAMRALGLAATAIAAGQALATSDIDFTPGDDDPDDILSGILKIGTGALVAATGGVVASNMLQKESFKSEFEADFWGASFSKKPWALRRALSKMERLVAAPGVNYAPEISQLFIIAPSYGNYETHPPTGERAVRLERLSSPLPEVAEVETIFCPYCGDKTDGDGAYCYWCGRARDGS